MKKLLAMMLMVSALSLSACGVNTVDQGKTGVEKHLGKVDPEPKVAGIYFINPLTTSITEMNNQRVKLDANTGTYTKDVQHATIDFTVSYNLVPSASVKMYSEVGVNWDEVIIPNTVAGELTNVIGKLNAVDLVSNREAAASVVLDALVKNLAPKGINVSGFQLTGIKFKKEFEDAVESKVIAIQKADEAKNQTVQIQEQANQIVISAKADAEAMKIKSEALSNNPGLTQYEMVQKWDGVLPTMVTNGNMMMQLPTVASK